MRSFSASGLNKTIHPSRNSSALYLLTKYHGRRGLYGSTRKGTLLESVPPGVTTWTSPVLAPAGTVVEIKDCDTTVNAAAVPLKLTLVAPVRLVPSISTNLPAFPEVGRVSRNGPRPTEKLKTVPSLSKVVP
jgi:hypothetical protein